MHGNQIFIIFFSCLLSLKNVFKKLRPSPELISSFFSTYFALTKHKKFELQLINAIKDFSLARKRYKNLIALAFEVSRREKTKLAANFYKLALANDCRTILVQNYWIINSLILN